jgi:hypothetical protein
MSIISSTVARLAVTTAASLAFAQVASAQTQPPTRGQGTQPGVGTHGHSSSPKAGETQEIQKQQDNMPATPSHHGGPAIGKSNQ